MLVWYNCLLSMAVLKYFVFCVFLFITISSAYFIYLLCPTSISSEQIRFVVPLEAKQEEVISQLQSQNFIRSPKLFTLTAGILRFPGTIEPGAYLLSRRMTTLGIADTLVNHPYQKWIVLVPGLRKEQVAEKFAKKFEWKESKVKEFLDNAREGYMFPDTYLINVDYAGIEVAQKLMSNFNEKFDAKIQQDLLSRDVRNDTAIKIASLIERESGGDSDRALIAGIIWNRLSKEMRLEIDATVQYALGTSFDWWPIVQGMKMKQVESPYNTYLYKGLPPAPICNPSLASIKAVVYPEDTDYLYYLHDRSRQIHPANTYKEHLENIEKYLR